MLSDPRNTKVYFVNHNTLPLSPLLAESLMMWSHLNDFFGIISSLLARNKHGSEGGRIWAWCLAIDGRHLETDISVSPSGRSDRERRYIYWVTRPRLDRHQTGETRRGRAPGSGGRWWELYSRESYRRTDILILAHQIISIKVNRMILRSLFFCFKPKYNS